MSSTDSAAQDQTPDDVPDKAPGKVSDQTRGQAREQARENVWEQASAVIPAQASATRPTGRRPLASRSTRWANGLAQRLAATSITPNQISLGSIIASGSALLLLITTSRVDSPGWVSLCLFLSALACQLRLLCNLMDGMVAIEAGKQTRDGAVWNELPDRIADVSFLVGTGIAAGTTTLGWAAALLAVSTTYVRELGKGIDGVVDFSGPMAKPHRMALLTLALMLAAIASILSKPLLYQHVLHWALWILCIGCLVTLYNRSSALLRRLQ